VKSALKSAVKVQSANLSFGILSIYRQELLNMRHFDVIDEDQVVVRSNGVGFSRGHHYPMTRYEQWHQLVYARLGTLTVTTEAGYWVVPPSRAVIVPAGVASQLRLHGRVTMSCLYLRGDFYQEDVTCTVISVPRLLRELIIHIVELGMLCRTQPSELRLALLVTDLLQEVEVEPLQLQVPVESRALQVFRLLEQEPGLCGSLSAIAERAGVGKRTMERIVRREMGMSFGRWRQQIRMYMALRMLADNHSVTDTALSVGYSTASAFVYAFREIFGRSPGEYFKETSVR
jgi:AraC-like DNA-binding protein